MQRMKQLATGAFSMLIATAGIAHAGGDHDQQHGTATDRGGRSSEPAPRTGSAASNDPTMKQSPSDARSAQPAPSQNGAQSANAQGSSSAQGSAMMAGAGKNRSQIQQAQRELQSRGLYSGAIDGVAGPQTMAAVEQFQAQQGLPTSGALDDATRRALGVQLDRQTVAGSQTAPGPELDRPVGREGGTPAASGAGAMGSQVQLERLNQEQLRTLQTRLSELGFYQGSVDGVLGGNTRAALRQFFQTQADLASRGVITDATVSLFGVSPHGLNSPSGATGQSQQMGGHRSQPGAAGSQPNTGSQSGTQPRGSQPRDSTSSPNGTSAPRPGGTQPQQTNPSQGTP